MSQGFDPSGVEMLNRARALLQSGSIDEALSMLHTYVSGNPKSSEGFELIGVAYAQKGMVNEGIQSLITAVNLNPGSASCRVNLAVAFQRAERIPEAVKQFQDALVIDPNNARARTGLAQLNALPPAPSYSPPPMQSPPNQPYGASPNPYAPPQPSPGYYPPPGGGVPPYPGSGYTTAPVYDDPDGWNPMLAFKVVSDPVSFFRKQRGQLDKAKPIYYALIWAGIAMVINMAMGQNAFGTTTNRTNMSDPAVMLGAIACGVPVALGLMVIGLFIMAGYLHLFAMMFGRSPNFVGTLRAMIYSWAPLSFAGIISVILVRVTGQSVLSIIIQLVGMIAVAYLLTVAYREIHDMETSKAALAAILPLVVFVVIIFVVAIAVGGLVASSGLNGGRVVPGRGF